MSGSWNTPRMRQFAAIGLLAVAGCQLPPDGVTPVEGAISQAAGGPIHGYVASAATDQRGAAINLPDIQVWAQNATTGAAGPRVRTNAAGYFHTPPLAAGSYNLCVGGTGYATRCETTVVTVAHSLIQLDHVLTIVPLAASVWGTVRLSDKTTPCFWFRPAFSTGTVVQAHVSLTDASGNLVAGPVNGNSLGEFVLPVAASPGSYQLNATCETSTGATSATLGTGSLHADLMVGNAPPAIAALDLTQGGVGVRRADPGTVVHATVIASDPDGDPLHYRWTDDSGRSLGLPDAASVDWTLIPGIARNTLRVQVSDGRGGYTVSNRDLQGGPNALLFGGIVLDRTTGAVVANAQITLNAAPTTTDARGQFQIAVPDAPSFVLNVRKQGYALASRIYYGRNTGLRIPLDPTVSQPLDAGKGGVLTFPCQRQVKGCDTGVQLSFPAGVLVDAKGNPYTGAATVEAFQYDSSQMNPLPGDQGAVVDGKALRLSTFGSFFLQPRDAVGNPLQMATGKLVPVSMPIESALQPTAPATIPFWRYDEDAGKWIPLGNLTRSGTRYQGQVNHFSAFNADTQFGGSACLKVILDSSFTLPVYLDAHYVDPSSGVFYHNNTQVTSNPIGIERMPPNTNFVLEVHDGTDNHLLKSVTLLSGPPLDPALFPDGSVSDPNFDACNGPVTVYNDAVLPTGPTFLLPITGGSIVDNSVTYRHATDADVGGSRDTLDHWKSANDFPGSDASAIYFNNGDLKFGRDMHCHVTSHGTTACYVSNHGIVGTDDEVTALADARGGAIPVATVTMEYDPAVTDGSNVQFWAYAADGSYLLKAALDGQGAKPLPDICMACHYGYLDGTTNKVVNAQFLPFDLGSFHYDTLGDPHGSSSGALAVQDQFRQLNKLVLDTTAASPTVQPGYQQLMNMWYPGGVGNPSQLFSFTNGAAQLSGTPFVGHEPLYDAVVAPTCRTCHIAHGSGDNWVSFGQMSSLAGIIQLYACGTGSAATQVTRTFAMPHAEVPFKRFWTDSLGSTLASMLTLSGCPNH